MLDLLDPQISVVAWSTLGCVIGKDTVELCAPHPTLSNAYVQFLIPISQSVTVFGDKVSKEVVS